MSATTDGPNDSRAITSGSRLDGKVAVKDATAKIVEAALAAAGNLTAYKIPKAGVNASTQNLAITNAKHEVRNGCGTCRRRRSGRAGQVTSQIFGSNR